jgi:catechol 2,3-dioxygenase-like lactoylglutathione lyase family enzyme
MAITHWETMIKLTICVIVGAVFCSSAFSQPVNAQLDHVVIAVSDLEAAKNLYAGLGFSIASKNGRHPSGTDNSTARLSDGYLELLTPFDSSLPDGRDLAERLKKGDGGAAAGLQIASAEQTALDLRTSGMNIVGPTPGTIMRPGDKEPAAAGWWNIAFGGARFIESPHPLFLIQYAPRPPRAVPTHPNSASSLSAVLIAVNDLKGSIAWYEKIGKVSNHDIALPEFGAVGKEVALERGTILLLRATDPSGPTARRINAQGEGILAVRLGASNMEQVRKELGSKNVGRDLQLALVSPENAAGIWLEFQALGQ